MATDRSVSSGLWPWVKRLVIVIFAIWLLGFCLLAALWAGWHKQAALPEPGDVIVCLGADMSYMGWDRPGPASARRGHTCADLQLAGVAPRILFTGYGHHVLSAAEAMADIAIAQGVAPEAIIIEPDAKSTIQNAVFGLDLLPQGTDRIILVTDAFHMPRSWLLFKLFGAPQMTAYAAHWDYSTTDKPQTRNALEWVLRESVVIWINLGRLSAYYIGGLLGIDEATRVSWFD